MMSVKITCIKKDNGNHENPYVAINSMNWLDETSQKSGTSTRRQMFDFLKYRGKANVMDAAGVKAVTTDKGAKYVKTAADDLKSKVKACN